MPALTKEFIEREYVENGRSWDQIGQELGLHANTVRRAAKKLGVRSRSRSKAQKVSLKNGTRKHPTEGKKHGVATKMKISRNIAAAYKVKPEEEKEVIRDKAKERWSKISDKDKAEMRSKAAKAVRKTGEKGSKLEHYILDKLRQNGFVVEFHKKQFVANEQLEADMYLPELQTVVEIDGPSHFISVYGEEQLAKRRIADQTKNGLLLKKGFFVIRVKHIRRHVSLAYFEEMANKTLEVLRKIKAREYNSEQKLIIVEETD